MRGTLRTLTGIILLVLLTSSAFGEDVWQGPPVGKWTRGDPGSTWQHWDFCTPNEIDPCYGQNNYGRPRFLPFQDPVTWQWFSDVPGPMHAPVTAWQALYENIPMSFEIPNQPVPNDIKYVFVQVTSTLAPITVNVMGAGPGASYRTGTWDTGLPPTQHPNEEWYTYTHGLTIEPNPEIEYVDIYFPAGAYVEQVVIDTICIPEPATLALLAVGGMMALARRRRKQ